MNRESYRRFIMLCPFWPFLIFFQRFFEIWICPTTTVLNSGSSGTRKTNGRRDGSIRALRKRRFRNKTREVFQIRVGDGGDDGGDDGDGDGRISPEHPSPILHAPRDIISRKGKSLTPTCPLKGIGVRNIYIGDFYAMPFFYRFWSFSNSFLRF